MLDQKIKFRYLNWKQVDFLQELVIRCATLHSIQVERVLSPNLNAIGVNNRNLDDFSVSVQHSYDLMDQIPDQFLKISESGIGDAKTIPALKKAGLDGFLMGECFIKTPNPALAMQDLVVGLWGK